MPPLLQPGFDDQGECLICGKVIKGRFDGHTKYHRDHNNWDFNCKFNALGMCDRFKNPTNNPSDCKLHMIKCHFTFDNHDNVETRKLVDLMKHKGTCGCGYHGIAKKWLHNHVLTDVCPLTKTGAVAPPPPQYQCSICDRNFYRSNDWYRHYMSHRGTWDFSCKFRHLGECGRYKGPFTRPNSCITHMLVAHFKFNRITTPRRFKLSGLYQKLGKCKCGYRGLAKTWVDDHVLGNQCFLIKEPCESDDGESGEA